MSPAGSEYEPQLTTEDDLQAITIEKVIPHDGPITLAEYNPQWPALFAREAARIRAVLGDAAVRVEHVGSTSVPGLAAKPVIDILLAVPDSAGEQAYAPALEAAGYVLRIREPDWFEHRLFTGPDTAINLHVFTVGAAEIDRMLLFRDRLRANDADRDAYLQVKRDLARRTWRHVQHYADSKTAIVQQIMARGGAAGQQNQPGQHAEHPAASRLCLCL
jgi:GrpB-like predicted nucleotidyltransferase (UPF0157 family)